MKLTVKTLKGTHFEIRVQPNYTIIAVKKNIEQVQGKDNYPWGQQLLIHNGKVLKDETTLEENKVSEDGFLVVMLSKSKAAVTSGASASQPSATSVAQHPTPKEAPPQAPSQTPSESPAQPIVAEDSSSAPARSQGPNAELSDAQVASTLVEGSNMEQTIIQLLEMGGGNWDRETILRALRAAYNNPERAVEYLYSGIPATAEIALPGDHFPSSVVSAEGADVAAAGPLSRVPNSSPLNMFPQGNNSEGGAGGGSLDFLRNSQQFLALRAMVQANPQILQPMLQELSKQNPQLLRLIQEHHAEFLQLINEPIEGLEGDLFDQPDQDEMPHTINVTPEEQEAIERLEALGFERARVIEAFLACDRNEQLAANYLLEHAGEED
ncbi:putative ubiquitin receptor RAD23a [Curcuma longa]|uniref:putative ubiquitin receptor RAD23a n=1 Tax=Curcuma longa TaxID=136217 RepID=UPI003D9EB292